MARGPAALLLLMPAIAIYAKVLAEPRETTNLRADALATLGYFARWRTIYAGKNDGQSGRDRAMDAG